MHKRIIPIEHAITLCEETYTIRTDDKNMNKSSTKRKASIKYKWSVSKTNICIPKVRMVAITILILVPVIKFMSYDKSHIRRSVFKDNLSEGVFIKGLRVVNKAILYHSNKQNESPLQQEVNYGSAFEEGDKSEEYALLRKEYDALLPVTDVGRMRQFVNSLKKNRYTTAKPQDMPYDIYNCPNKPPKNYPFAWNVLTVLKNWEIDDPTPRQQIYQGLCVFDYDRDYDKALNYRNAELPFVIQNDPRVLRTTERWNQPHYLFRLLGNKFYKGEYSPTNHFMYWNPPDIEEIRHLNRGLRKQVKNWKAPTEKIKLTYEEWLNHANTSNPIGPTSEHWYFRLVGCGLKSSTKCNRNLAEYLFDELDFFRVDHETSAITNPPSIYIVEPSRQSGINCRFGMKGVVAENHFDVTRNVIVVLGGQRRYLLAHPSQAQNMELYPEGHPSARHSAVDWSNPDLDSYPRFHHAQINEVVLQAADVLYLPTNWFHHIVSLELNYQCNTRSGRTSDYDMFIRDAGFNFHED